MSQVCLNNLAQITIGGLVCFLIQNYEVIGWIVVWWGVFSWCCSLVCSRIVHPKLKCEFVIGLCHNARQNGFSFRSKLLRSMGFCCRNQKCLTLVWDCLQKKIVDLANFWIASPDFGLKRESAWAVVMANGWFYFIFSCHVRFVFPVATSQLN